MSNLEDRMCYPVIIHRMGTGYSVDVPDLPDCVATGTTIEHARQMIAEAIEMHLQWMQRAGDAPLVPSSRLKFSVGDDSAEEFFAWVEVELPQPVIGS